MRKSRVTFPLLNSEPPAQASRNSVDTILPPAHTKRMRTCDCIFVRWGTLLAINLLFLMVWGFAGISKLIEGMPAWFPDKFGPTFMAKFPGLTATFWMLAVAELIGFGLAVVALARLEFVREPLWLARMLTWSLFVFLMLSFGQWLTKEFNGTFQQFCYFTGALLALHITENRAARPSPYAKTPGPST